MGLSKLPHRATIVRLQLLLGASIASFVGHCQYLSHFSTIWAEIFFGNTLVGNSNVNTTKNFKLQPWASIASFLGHCQYLSHFKQSSCKFYVVTFFNDRSGCDIEVVQLVIIYFCVGKKLFPNIIPREFDHLEPYCI